MKKRIQRLNQLIKKEVAQLILREIEFPKDVLVTVTRAEVTLDLRESNFKDFKIRSRPNLRVRY